MRRIPQLAWDQIERLRTDTDDLGDAVQHMAEQARDYYDGRSEGWQNSVNGEHYYDWLFRMEEAADQIESLRQSLDPISREPIRKTT